MVTVKSIQNYLGRLTAPKSSKRPKFLLTQKDLRLKYILAEGRAVGDGATVAGCDAAAQASS